MRLLAIDTGPETCGVVLIEADQWPPDVTEQSADVPVAAVLAIIAGGEWHGWKFAEVAAERITGYAQEVGGSTFETCEVFGDIRNECRHAGLPFVCITRKEVKQRLGLPTSAKGPQVNAVIRHTYPATGGGATPQKGTKAQPGPLYGIKDHAWAALGVGLAWCLELERERRAAELEALKARNDAGGSLFDSTLQSEP